MDQDRKASIHSQANWLDVDYYGDSVMEEQPRKLTAIEWERKLREEDQATHTRRRGKKKEIEMIEEDEEEKKEALKNTRFGAFSGATADSVVDDSVESTKPKIGKMKWS